MMNVVTIRKDSTDSPRTEVGEIDTSTPIQSVKAAACLFGDTISSPSTQSASIQKSKSQGLLDKQVEIHFTRKELGKFKNKVQNAESEANEQLPELEKAMKALMYIKDKINAVNASKESIIEDTETLRIKAKELEQEKTSPKVRNGDEGLETIRKQYKEASVELDSAKQELSRLHKEINSAMEDKLSALCTAEEAQIAAMAHSKKVSQLRESLDQMKLSERAREVAKEEVKTKSHGFLQDKETKGLHEAEALQLKLEEMNKEIEDLKQEIIQAKEVFSESERNAYSELSSAREAYKKLDEERQSLQGTIESIKQELSDVESKIGEIKDREDEEKSLESRLRVELQERKLELEAMLAREVKETEDSKEMEIKLEKLLKETRQAKEEAWEMRNAENELKIASGRKGLDDRDQKKELLKEEYDDLKKKASGSEKMAEMKVASAMAELEGLKASKSEVEKKLKESGKEIEELDKASEEAFKQADMAEEAKRKAVSELSRIPQEQSC